MDPFETVTTFTPGAFVVVNLSATSAMAGVVAAVDLEARSLTFTDGRRIDWPPVTEAAPDVELEKEEVNG